MIEGAVGYPGGGKTYYALWRINRELKKGRKVYTNFNADGTEQVTFETMFNMEPSSFVVLDEAQNWFGSRNWAQFGNKYMEFFSQTRKKEYTLLWLSQDVSSVDKTIRDRTHLIHELQSFGKNFVGHPIFFVCNTYYGAKNIGKEKHHAQRKFIRFHQDIADAYDTHEVIASRLTDTTKRFA